MGNGTSENPGGKVPKEFDSISLVDDMKSFAVNLVLVQVLVRVDHDLKVSDRDLDRGFYHHININIQYPYLVLYFTLDLFSGAP